jgi:hypothetical protein
MQLGKKCFSRICLAPTNKENKSSLKQIRAFTSVSQCLKGSTRRNCQLTLKNVTSAKAIEGETIFGNLEENEKQTHHHQEIGQVLPRLFN